MEDIGRISRREAGGGIWFALNDTNHEQIASRLAEQLPVYRALREENFLKRTGQALEIAIWRAIEGQRSLTDHLGHFLDLDHHDDSALYRKEEPPRRLGHYDIRGDRRLDFMVRHPTAGWAGIEAKNIREWLYPNRDEIRDLLSKCYALNVVPVLIARRIHFSTFVVLNACGAVLHQTYNQLLPAADAALAARAKHKNNLGYHDIRTGNEPDARLQRFFADHLPSALPERREKFEQFKDLIGSYAEGHMDYPEFAGRLRRRRDGQRNEDSDWDEFLP